MNSLRIRELKEDDIPEIVRIIEQTMGERDAKSAEKHFKAYVKRRHKYFEYSYLAYFIAELEGKPVGIIGDPVSLARITAPICAILAGPFDPSATSLPPIPYPTLPASPPRR